ncbi:TetR/AcrR family transcriptional regulator [Amycolatopsis methanolica]|uniref:TetR/AcrR family transcriptional regulator n=1 Tax=Amycolatopsis methanolica TaxID=1814 RepID=UPI003419CBA1
MTRRRNRDDEVLTVAMKVFYEKGYLAASLQDVAAAVGIKKGSLYYYMTSKEEMLFRIFQQAHDESTAIMDEVDALGLPVQDKLREYVRRLIVWYLANRERANLYFTEWHHLTGDYAETVRGHRRLFESYVRKMILTAHEQGLTKADMDVKVMSFFVLSAVTSVPTWYRPGGSWSPDVVASQTANLACTAVFGEIPATR